MREMSAGRAWGLPKKLSVNLFFLTLPYGSLFKYPVNNVRIYLKFNLLGWKSTCYFEEVLIFFQYFSLSIRASDWEFKINLSWQQNPLVTDEWMSVKIFTGHLCECSFTEAWCPCTNNSWGTAVADPGGQGAISPGPVKINHKKDGRRRRLHRFHVSWPPPLLGRWIHYWERHSNVMIH